MLQAPFVCSGAVPGVDCMMIIRLGLAPWQVTHWLTVPIRPWRISAAMALRAGRELGAVHELQDGGSLDD
jgi:hypothetical protein